VIGLVALGRYANLLTTVLAGLTLLAYLFAYTPLKRISPANTIVGAVPGAMPPVLGWTAAAGELSAGTLALFAILFLWQLPHFLSIAWLYRDDYAAGGYKMFSLGDDSGRRTGRQMLVQCLALMVVSVLPVVTGIAGAAYLAGAQIAGLLFLASALGFLLVRTRRAARVVLSVSLLYLPGIFGLLALGI
jgi:protoheme IX farnesyltransferase